MTRASTTHIPVTRADVLCLYHHGFEAMGAPVQQLLEQAAIPPGNPDIPDALIPLRNAYRFAELACSSLQSENLGLYIGLESSLDNYGVYGCTLQSALTVGALSGDSRDLHIDRIAESLGMSRRTLQRAIGREGLTYLGLVNEYRLRKARDWLDGSEKPVTEIALDLGYTDASNFSRAFRRHIGLTPTEYRALDERPDSTYSPLK